MLAPNMQSAENLTNSVELIKLNYYNKITYRAFSQIWSSLLHYFKQLNVHVCDSHHSNGILFSFYTFNSYYHY